MPSTSVQVRLPDWAREYLEDRAGQRNTSKTAIVVEAIKCLRSQEIAELMREGYQERAAEAQRMAEEDLGGTVDTLPDW